MVRRRHCQTLCHAIIQNFVTSFVFSVVMTLFSGWPFFEVCIQEDSGFVLLGFGVSNGHKVNVKLWVRGWQMASQIPSCPGRPATHRVVAGPLRQLHVAGRLAAHPARKAH